MEIIGLLFNTIVYNPMLNALLWLYSIIPNYGVDIIIFTILIGSVTAPFRVVSQNSMRKQQSKMALLKPKLDELKKKYKDQPQQLQSAQMKLYQENGVANPFNAGCLLTLLPFPIFIGLYQVINGVMADHPDQVMTLANRIYPQFQNAAMLIPVNSNFFGLNLALSPSAQGIFITVILVGLVVGASYLQTRMMQQPTAALDASTAQMNQSMTLMTPLIFGFFVLNAPTGLSLYWITFSVIGIIQQGFTGGWSSLTNLIPQRAPEPVRTKKVADAPSGTTSPKVNGSNGNGNQNQLAASSGGSAPKVSKGKKNRDKKR